MIFKDITIGFPHLVVIRLYECQLVIKRFPKFMETEIMNAALFSSLSGAPSDVCAFIVMMMSQKYVYLFQKEKWYRKERDTWKITTFPYDFIQTVICPVYQHLLKYYIGIDCDRYRKEHLDDDDDEFSNEYNTEDVLRLLKWLNAQLLDSLTCKQYIKDIEMMFACIHNDDEAKSFKLADQLARDNIRQHSYMQDQTIGYTSFIDQNNVAKFTKILFHEHWLYIRAYNELVAKNSKNQKNLSKITFNWKKIKIGIAANLTQRAQTYGNDKGWFYYAIPFESEKEALYVEGILRKIFQPYAVEGSKEYFDAEKLAIHLNVPNNVENSYDLTLHALHEFALTYARRNSLVHPCGYGYKFIPYLGNDQTIQVTRQYLTETDIHSPIQKPKVQDNSTKFCDNELEIERERTKQLKLKNENLVLEKEILRLKLSI